jgi:hypothetical protein
MGVGHLILLLSFLFFYVVGVVEGFGRPSCSRAFVETRYCVLWDIGEDGQGQRWRFEEKNPHAFRNSSRSSILCP